MDDIKINVRKIRILMNLYMGLTMSFVLSLTGTLVGGHFTVASWLISFGTSFILSLVIGFIIPIKPLCDFLGNKLGLKERTFAKNLFDSFISNIIYTPLLSLAMVFQARMHIPLEHRPPLMSLYLPSLAVTFFVGWILIFIVQPLFIRKLLSKQTKVQD